MFKLKSAILKKNMIANYIGQFYSMAIGIFMLPFYLEYLGAEAYGLVGFFTVLTSWMVLLDLGLSTTLARETSRLKDKENGIFELKRLTLSIEAFFGIISILVFIPMFFLSGWISAHWLDVKELVFSTVENTIYLMIMMIAFRLYVGLYQGAIIGFEQQVWLNKYKVIVATFKFVGSFLLIAFVSDDIVHFFLYQLLIGFLEFLIIKIKINKLFKVSVKVKPSFMAIKQIAPFTLSIAYASVIWIFTTQLDKLMLSHYLSLQEYGFFALVIVVSNAILQLFQPIGQAILPRMTSLLSNGKEAEMLELYHKATQIVSIIVLATSGMIAVFSYELLYSWTGNIEAATWVAPILFWYALGNGAVALLSFQYYIQYAYGNLKYLVKGNTFFGFFQIAIIAFSIHFYGAIGAAISWFGLQILFLLFWPWYIHNKFASDVHKDWLFKDIAPIFLVTVLYLFVLKNIGIEFSENRIVMFLTLLVMGVLLLLLNSLASNYGRKIIKDFFVRKKI